MFISRVTMLADLNAQCLDSLIHQGLYNDGIIILLVCLHLLARIKKFLSFAIQFSRSTVR